MKIYKFIILFIFIFLCSKNLCSQLKNDPENPRSWSYFKIDVNINDDAFFVQLQTEVGIDPPMSSYSIIVNLTDLDPRNQYITFGDEIDPNARTYPWNILSKEVQNFLINWAGVNKMNLIKSGFVLTDPLWYSLKQIRLKETLNTLSYINPYLQIFGGERLGIPIKGNFGLNFGIGTKYSGPFESDQVSAGINIIGFSINYITRVRGLNSHYLGKDKKETGLWKQYNNIFSPSNAVEVSYTLPFGTFIKVGIMKDFGKDSKSGPPEYTFYEKGDSSTPMANNIVEGTYLNMEIKYPFRFFGSAHAQFYTAYYAKEVHIGLLANEMRLGGSVCDIRTDFTITKMRNFQFLFEYMFSLFGEGFSLSSVAIGPSIRFTTLENGKFGVHTFFINARFKLGNSINY